MWDELGLKTCVDVNIGPLEWPASIGSFNVNFFAVDWSSGFSISVCWDNKEVSGSGFFTYNVGVTLGIAIRKTIKGLSVFGMIGVRGFSENSGGVEVKGTVDPKTCEPNFNVTASANSTLGLEGGAILRVSRGNRLLTELGAGGRATLKVSMGGELDCIGKDCVATLFVKSEDSADISIFANFGWFDASFQDSVKVKHFEYESKPAKIKLPNFW